MFLEAKKWTKFFFFMAVIFAIESAPSLLSGIEYQRLQTIMREDVESQPFVHNIDIKVVKGHSEDEPVMVCFHGYGSCNKVIDIMSTYREIPDHLVSFNFPDYCIKPNSRDPQQTTFGTIDELLPAIYVLKKIVIDGGAAKVDMYGFSAGGGALINTIAVLNSSRFDKEIASVGVSLTQRKTLLNAIQNGNIILDTPLKSIEEIIAFRGPSPELEVYDQRYRSNALVPIDSIKNLHNLSLNVLLHFQANDEALSNRDDKLYISELRRTNHNGKNCVVIGNDGGHSSYHKSLWKFYPEFINGPSESSCVIEYSQ